jgi:hypothetical protein
MAVSGNEFRLWSSRQKMREAILRTWQAVFLAVVYRVFWRCTRWFGIHLWIEYQVDVRNYDGCFELWSDGFGSFEDAREHAITEALTPKVNGRTMRVTSVLRIDTYSNSICIKDVR